MKNESIPSDIDLIRTSCNSTAIFSTPIGPPANLAKSFTYCLASLPSPTPVSTPKKKMLQRSVW